MHCVNNFDTSKEPFYINNFLNINWIGFSLSFLSTQHVKWYWKLFAILSDAFGMVFRWKNNEASTNVFTTSSIFSPVLSNVTLFNAPSFDRHVIQATLLNIDGGECNLFVFFWRVLQINFLSEVLKISAVWFKILLESSLLMSNLSLLLFISVLFVITL